MWTLRRKAMSFRNLTRHQVCALPVRHRQPSARSKQLVSLGVQATSGIHIYIWIKMEPVKNGCVQTDMLTPSVDGQTMSVLIQRMVPSRTRFALVEVVRKSRTTANVQRGISKRHRYDTNRGFDRNRDCSDTCRDSRTRTISCQKCFQRDG